MRVSGLLPLAWLIPLSLGASPLPPSTPAPIASAPRDNCPSRAAAGWAQLPDPPRTRRRSWREIAGPIEWRDGRLVFLRQTGETFDACARQWTSSGRPPSATAERGIDLGAGVRLFSAGSTESDTEVFAGAKLRLPNGTVVTLPAAGAPAPRDREALAFVANRLFVWGGWVSDLGSVSDGAVFDVAKRAWKPVSQRDAPSRRFSPMVVADGRRLLLLGGLDEEDFGAPPQALSSGGQYDPVADRWTPLSWTGGPPIAREPDTIQFWTGEALIMSTRHTDEEDGSPRQDVYSFDPTHRRWQVLGVEPAPSESGAARRVFAEPDGVLLVAVEAPFHLFEIDVNRRAISDLKIPYELSQRAVNELAWTGERLFVHGGFGLRRARGPSPCPHLGYDPPSPRPFGDLWEFRREPRP